MRSDYTEPLNLGQDRMVTVNELADMITAIAGVEIVKTHVDGPQGVRGRNSDNTLLREILGLGARNFAGRRARADVHLDRGASSGVVERYGAPNRLTCSGGQEPVT